MSQRPQVSAPDQISLPEPDTGQLGQAPLELVVCQLRHERMTPAPDARFALDIQSKLTDPYPEIAQAGGTEVIVDRSVREVASDQGWHLKSEDGAWTVVLMPDFVALECLGYTSWSDFMRRMRDLLEAVSDVSAPALMQRIGLRYVDRLVRTDTRQPTQWQGSVDASLLGLGANPQVGQGVVAAQTITQLQINGVDVLLRSSCAPDHGTKTGYSMVLDTDAYDDQGRAFELSDVEDALVRLHRVSLQLFQLVVTADFRKELEGGS